MPRDTQAAGRAACERGGGREEFHAPQGYDSKRLGRARQARGAGGAVVAHEEGSRFSRAVRHRKLLRHCCS
jgi:hypothetical protein